MKCEGGGRRAEGGGRRAEGGGRRAEGVLEKEILYTCVLIVYIVYHMNNETKCLM